MARLIKQFHRGEILEYDAGSFDEWCVYLKYPNEERYAPKDAYYFREIYDLAYIFTPSMVYSDFVSIYQKTGVSIEEEVLDYIEEISRKYYFRYRDVEIMFTTIYASMVAEMNKKNTILKKRIKRLGVHQVLFDGISALDAAKFSKGKPWRELDQCCRERGF